MRRAWGVMNKAGLLLGVALVLGAQPAAGGARGAVGVDLLRTSVRQGEVLRLTLRTPSPATRAEVRFAGRQWPIYPVGRGEWRTILGTDPSTPPGRHTLTVKALYSGGAVHITHKALTVVRVAFPRREIVFDPALAPLLAPEAAERERRKVAEALRTLHPQQLWTDPFMMPLAGKVISAYGTLNVYHGQARGFHGGVDILAPEGTPVRTAGDGIVRLAGPLPLSGQAVLVDHGLGVVTSYLHLSEVGVRAGERIRRGQVLGRVGSTGLSTGPHLHWGVRVNGVRVDPIPWLGR